MPDAIDPNSTDPDSKLEDSVTNENPAESTPKPEEALANKNPENAEPESASTPVSVAAIAEARNSVLGQIKIKAEKLGIEIDDLLMLPMTHENLLYLLDQCPYLQIVNSEVSGQMTAAPKLFKAQSGWTVLDYGDAMSSSPGELVFADSRPDPHFLTMGLGTRSGQEEDTEGGSGRGTMVKQAVDTAAEMVFLAIQRGWKGVTVVEGHPRMRWAAWVMAGDHEFPMEGYEPSESDLARRKRLRRSRTEIDDLYMKVSKTMGS